MYEIRHDIKIYQINTSFYEFKDFNTPQEIIEYIVSQHQEKIDLEVTESNQLQTMEKDDIVYSMYVFNTYERKSSWKDFLPSQITQDHSLNVRTASFVLFATIDSKIFAIIGGNGIAVIKRYRNHTFGLDLFEKIADPSYDIVISMESRGIAGNLSSQKVTFRNEQKLIDSISFARIPNCISLQLREELIADVFDFIQFGNTDNNILNIGSSFHLKVKLSFLETHLLFKRINEILDTPGGTPLSSFERIRNKNLTENSLRLQLYQAIRDDMMRTIPPGGNPDGIRFDCDFLHPSKLVEFYECDRYDMYERGAKTPFFETTDKSTLYRAGLQFLFDNTDHSNIGDFNYKISGIRVYGYKGSDRPTHAMYTDHITCDIPFNGRPVFHIDAKWYKVKGNFIKSINDLCISMIRSNYLKDEIINETWNINSEDEGAYNLKYANKDNYIVLDKMLGQNIELCDILYEESDTIYLVHVKAGFDAKIRDLSNQITISSNRLWNDIQSGSYEFITRVVSSYNRKNSDDLHIDSEEFKEKFNKNIVYVMAFSSQLSNNKTVIDNIRTIKSNIAKFSLIQCVRDMQTNYFPLKIVEIMRE